MMGTRRPRLRFVRSDATRRFQAVHLRHLNIHEDQIEIVGRRQRDRLVPRVGDGHVMPPLSQNAHCQLLVERTVFGQQDAEARHAVFRLRGRRFRNHHGRSRLVGAQKRQQSVEQL